MYIIAHHTAPHPPHHAPHHVMLNHTTPRLCDALAMCKGMHNSKTIHYLFTWKMGQSKLQFIVPFHLERRHKHTLPGVTSHLLLPLPPSLSFCISRPISVLILPSIYMYMLRLVFWIMFVMILLSMLLTTPLYSKAVVRCKKPRQDSGASKDYRRWKRQSFFKACQMLNAKLPNSALTVSLSVSLLSLSISVCLAHRVSCIYAWHPHLLAVWRQCSRRQLVISVY